MAKILAADIGGTNSRFALFETTDDGFEMVDSIWLATQSARSFPHLLEQLWSSRFSACPGDFESAVFAVAGAVVGGVSCPRLTNASWGIDIRDIDFGTDTVCVINDFAAQAYACRTSAVDNATVIQEGHALDGDPIGVIGAGTGLGYSALLPSLCGWSALPFEGGHMTFPFVGAEEMQYAAFNQRESGRHWPEGDSVVTGLGLHLVHKYLTGEDLTPEAISASITINDSTTRWYARFYARVCRDWAIGVMSRGGLFIAGGIAAKNPMFVTASDFLEEFHNSHIYEDFLHTVPIRLNCNEESGLYGAGFYGNQRLMR
ncbi:glucokinase [Pseudodesulfovibrio sp. JC047]|uniref:glucokinase n=1 Tax=Pseudodesulfovibrio sp. JC047 TaxID=2683199 RepID=UPI0013D40F89|nr:glucokinase [Pseudodesulfovibrio sp. JC047]NDV20171.1 glucokinase [Pseudodesulfovibrio sp. JC047]